jgi:hypothetical protein
MNEEVAIGSLMVRQQELVGGWTPSRDYDVLLAGLSWEPRGTTALSAMSGGTNRLTLLKFASRSAEVEALKQKAKAQFDGRFDVSEILDLHASIDTQPNFRKLEGWLRDKYVSAGRPLRILLDITCLPKTYLLFLLGVGFTRDYVACFDCVYAGGVYELNTTSSGDGTVIGGPRALVSEGEWQSRQIPYLEPRDVVADNRDLLVTLGGELGLSLPFIEKFEPRRLGLVFIKETAPTAGTPMPQSEQSALSELLGEPNALRTDISLGDVVGVANHAVEFVRQSKARTITGIAIGAKPHALALGIAALAADQMEVVCRTPAAYKPVDVKPSGRLFMYSVEDRFEPCSYLNI